MKDEIGDVADSEDLKDFAGKISSMGGGIIEAVKDVNNGMKLDPESECTHCFVLPMPEELTDILTHTYNESTADTPVLSDLFKTK